jgi:prepilin-type N-terminal cleavage/methylation domain-containing protein
MKNSRIEFRQSEKGFTLVELAIVMVIIGLLIGGVLKGQELIRNARISSAVAQVKASDTAVAAFRDRYGELPGDGLKAPGQLQNCTGTMCANAGTGDNMIDGQTTNAGGAATTASESGRAFPQLVAANMLTAPNVLTTGTWAGVSTYPTFPLGGAIRLRANINVVPTTSHVAAQMGNFYVLGADPAGAVVDNANANEYIRVADSYSIDAKLDDGLPNTGNVFAGGATGTTAIACMSGNGTAAVYNSKVSGTSARCVLFLKSVL